MRDPPERADGQFATLAFAETDAEGRFAIVQLLPGVYDVEVPGQSLVTGTPVRAGADEVTIAFATGGTVSGHVVDERGEALPGAEVTLLRDDVGGEPLRTRSGNDGSFRLDGADAAAHYRAVASFDAGPGIHRASPLTPVEVGAADVALRVDAGPRLAVRVNFGRRLPERAEGPNVRLVHVGPDPVEREFVGPRVLWRCAPEGTWRVLARVREFDATGERIDAWVPLATITTGDFETTYAVPE